MKELGMNECTELNGMPGMNGLNGKNFIDETDGVNEMK